MSQSQDHKIMQNIQDARGTPQARYVVWEFGEQEWFDDELEAVLYAHQSWAGWEHVSVIDTETGEVIG